MFLTALVEYCVSVVYYEIRVLCECCVLDQSCGNFFIRAKVAPFDDRTDD